LVPRPQRGTSATDEARRARRWYRQGSAIIALGTLESSLDGGIGEEARQPDGFNHVSYDAFSFAYDHFLFINKP
jgi:hypothetical protein